MSSLFLTTPNLVLLGVGLVLLICYCVGSKSLRLTSVHHLLGGTMTLSLSDAKLILERFEQLDRIERLLASLVTQENLMSLADELLAKIADVQATVDATQATVAVKIAELEAVIAALSANPTAADVAASVAALEAVKADLESTFPAPAPEVVIEAPAPDAPADPAV
jgi:hypothetical protein